MPTGDPVAFNSALGPCGCHQGAWWGVTPPPMCPAHAPRTYDTFGAHPRSYATSSGTTAIPVEPQRLADDDVERIARRVAELLATKETP